MSENIYSDFFLSLLSQIKLFHWCAIKYSHHTALDKLYNSLSDNIDKFMEIYIGRFNKQPIIPFNISMTITSDINNVHIYLNTQKEVLRKIRINCNKAPELQNILDEIHGDINRTIYILNLE
jgi:hypothetical protein